MNLSYLENRKKAVEDCEAFNARYPVGVRGIVTTLEGKRMYTYTKFAAQAMGDAVVVFLGGIPGAYPLNSFEPEEVETND